MKRLIYIISALFCLAGCIDNDLPYPIVEPHIISMDVQGAENVEVDFDERLVTVYFPETTDLRRITITSVQFDEEITVPSIKLVGTHDLSRPLKFDLTTYDDYSWRIVGVRNIERYFNVEGQVGKSVIDHVNCRAVAMVSLGQDLSNINVTSLKLGPAGLTTYSKDYTTLKDFSKHQTIDVTAFDVTETWNLYIEVTEIMVEIAKVNPWAHEAYVTANGIAGRENRICYRLKGTESWTEVSAADMSSDGGNFTAHIRNLQPETCYETVAYSGSDISSIVEFTTEQALPIPNGSFEYASKVQDNGREYYKFYDPDCGVEDGSFMFWGSGNGEGSEGSIGSASMGIIITYIDTEDKIEGNQSVRAQTSQLAGILAAGNLFTGQFAGLVGTSGGKVNFGRPWTTRPTALNVYCKYSTGKVDIIKDMPPGVSITNNDYDSGEVKFALGNWNYKDYGGTPESPVHINTTDSGTFVDFATDKSTIAYGNLLLHHDGYQLNGGDHIKSSTDQWVKYTIPLNYRDMETIPTHIIVSFASSRYGDYFTGCSSSKLWIDAVELVY